MKRLNADDERGRLPGVLAALRREVLNVVFPRGCAGCACPDTVLCPSCELLFSKAVKRALPSTLIASGEVVACAEYAGPVRQAILQWKDHGDYEVGTLLAAHLAGVAQATMTQSGYAGLRDGTGALGELAVAPVPSSAASRMKRGRLQTMELARCVARQLRACGVPARVVEGLTMPRLQAKSVQSGGVRGRARRARSGLRVRLRAFPPRCSGVVLVDDICTTGSTILGCARSLHSAGIAVVAAFTLATVTG